MVVQAGHGEFCREEVIDPIRRRGGNLVRLVREANAARKRRAQEGELVSAVVMQNTV